MDTFGKSTPAWPLIAAILASVACSALAQVVLKGGLSAGPVQGAILRGGVGTITRALATSPMLWMGLLLYGVSAVVWLYVLAKLDVSVAYAFVALGFLLTMALGCVLLGEPLTARKLAGTALIVFGIWLVAGRA